MKDILSSKSVVVCMGPGGVGKTTTAAAIGIAGAQLGLRVVVLTVDPARRLAQAMGLTAGDAGCDSEDQADSDSSAQLGHTSALGNEARQITGIPGIDGAGTGQGCTVLTGELWAAMLDPQATFDSLIVEHATSTDQSDRILTNPIYRNLTTTLSGTSEYMATERLRALHLDDRFDLVVLDTPPAHHAINLLDSPGRLSRLVSHRIYRTLLSPKTSAFRAVSAATTLAVKALGQVIGVALLENAIEFFAAFKGMDHGFAQRAAEIDQVLASDETAYVLVTSPRSEPLRAGRWITEQLAARNRSLSAVVVNRMTPDFWPPSRSTNSTKTKPDGDRNQLSTSSNPLQQNLDELTRLRRSEEKLIERELARLPSGSSDSEPILVLLNEQAEPVNDLTSLIQLSKSL